MTSGKSHSQSIAVLTEANDLLKQGRAGAAGALLEEFLNAGGDDVVILRGLARIMMLQGRPQEAALLLKRALVVIQAEKNLSLRQISIPSPSPSVNGFSDEDGDISESDLTFIRETAASIRLRRTHFQWDEGTTLNSRQVGLPCHGEEGSYLPPSEPESESTTCNNDTVEAHHDEAALTQVDLFSFEDEDVIEEEILDELPEPDAIEDFLEIHSISPADCAYEYDWEEYEPSGIDYDDDISGETDREVPTTDRITRLQRARQIAVDLGSEYGWDEDGIDLLTKIFFRHGWIATRSSMRRELEAGITPLELLLAEQTRDIWFDYPEFSEVISSKSGLYQKYLQLPWPSAIALVRSFGIYPDISEIEKLLIDLYHAWRDKLSGTQPHRAFKLYLEQCIGRARSCLKDAPWLSFENEELVDGSFELNELDEIHKLQALRVGLLEFGINLDSGDIHRRECPKVWINPWDSDSDNKVNEASPKTEVDYRIGDYVRILAGHYEDQKGEVRMIYRHTGKLKILMSIDSRWTETKVHCTEVERVI